MNLLIDRTRRECFKSSVGTKSPSTNVNKVNLYNLIEVDFCFKDTLKILNKTKMKLACQTQKSHIVVLEDFL